MKICGQEKVDEFRIILLYRKRDSSLDCVGGREEAQPIDLLVILSTRSCRKNNLRGGEAFWSTDRRYFCKKKKHRRYQRSQGTQNMLPECNLDRSC